MLGRCRCRDKREIGGKDASRLSSDARARLSGSQAAEVSEVGVDRVKVVAVEAVCGIHQRPFLLYLEQKDGTWEVQRAYPLPDTQDVVHTRTPAVPEWIVGTFTAVPLKGKILMGSEYTGCAYCLDPTILRCGCKALSCKGASRRHEDHEDALCGRCKEWACLRTGGTGKGIDLANVDGYTALANSSVTEVEFLYQKELAKSAVDDTKKIEDSSEKSGKMLPESQTQDEGIT